MNLPTTYVVLWVMNRCHVYSGDYTHRGYYSNQLSFYYIVIGEMHTKHMAHLRGNILSSISAPNGNMQFVKDKASVLGSTDGGEGEL